MANISRSRKSGVFIRGGVARRETLWFSFPMVSSTLGASGTAVFQASLNAAALALRPFTIVRSRFNWLCVSDQNAATEQFVGNFGMCVVSDQAIAIGITALPTPATDLGSDLWFLHQSWIGQFQLNAAGMLSEGPKDIDSKSMRKVVDGQDIAAVVEAGIGLSGVVVRTVGRMLIKLH